MKKLKNVFTVREKQMHSPNNVKNYASMPLCLYASKKIAFTLAEVLITLAIIGVVAALTIPTLWDKVNSKVSDNQNKVFQAKLIQALNLTKTAGEFNSTYSSTEDFLRNGLAKHYKMVSICGKDNLRECIPYDKINFDKNATVNVADLKTSSSINVTASGFEDTAAFVTADGVPALVTYKKDCIVDTEMLDKSISSCLAGIYDLNGSKLPNKYGVIMDGETISSYTNDIHSFNGASIGYPKINGVEIVVKAFKPYDSTIYNDSDVGAPKTSDGKPDYWTAAQKWCEKNGGTLPTNNQLIKIGEILYNGTLTFNNSTLRNLDWSVNKVAVFEALGIDTISDNFILWSAMPYGDGYAQIWSFRSESIGTNGNGLSSGNSAICVK